MTIHQSKQLFERAQRSIPGGVNSPVRAFKHVGGSPLFIQKARGAYLFDEDGNRYIDYINSWGPMILGHAFEPVVEAIRATAAEGTSFGAPTLLEIEMAELVKSMIPNVDLIRMVNSGTEACMSAVRLARGYTGRNKIIQFEGCYHGHADCFLVNAGSGVATQNIQTVPGVTMGTAQDTLSAPYNDLDFVEKLVQEHRGDVAAVILEPVAGNMGCVPPQAGFLADLRRLCDTEGIVLIFDEVMTGFRLARGGAQEAFGIEADLVTYGKIIGGGMPVGAFGGRREIMEHIAPLGSVYQAGTLSGNPLAMAAGIATLRALNEEPDVYAELEEKTAGLAREMGSILLEKSIPHTINRYGSMISVFFTDGPVSNFKEASKTDRELFGRFFHHLLDNGVYLPPSAYESWFISTAVTAADVDQTLAAVRSFGGN